jgi:hypothetical protein
LVLAGCLYHLAALNYGQGERFFDIDILICLAGMDGHQGMPMVRSANHDSVDVLPIQHRPVIAKQLYLVADPVHCKVQIGARKVAQANNFGVRVLKECLKHLVAAVTQADKAKADAFACA